MAKKNNEDWSELCSYVKLHILRYGDDLKFPKYLALRLRGLASGNFISNKNIKSDGEYSYQCILMTFKLCKSRIISYMDTNQIKIKDERHKINLIMSFVEKEINDVKIRMKSSDKQQEYIKDLDVDIQFHESADYIHKTESSRIYEKMKHLW